MPGVQIFLNTNVNGETVKGCTGWKIKEYYNKFTSVNTESLFCPNDSKLTVAIINSTFWVTIEPLTDYKITKVYYSWSQSTPKKEYTNFTDKLYCNVTGDLTILKDYLFVEVAEDIKEFNFQQNLVNCVSSDKDTTIEGGEQMVTITANSGYFFEEEPTCNMCTITLDETRTIAYIYMSVTGDTILNANAVKLVRYYDLTQELHDCTSSITGDKIAEGKQNITFTANDGYEFRVNGSICMSGYDWHDIPVGTDKQHAFLNDLDVTGTVQITMTGQKITEQLGDFVLLYKTTSAELDKLSKVRFYNDNAGGKVMDWGAFIYSLINLPFAIPEEMLADFAYIKLGSYVSSVNSTILSTHVLNVNIGSVKVDEKYHNVYDYINTQCFLHLPYHEKVELPIDYVINHKISVNYVIDLYNGTATLNVVSDFINNVFKSDTFEIGYKIPFISQQDNTVVSKEINGVIDNKIRTAFIEVVRNVPYDTDTVFGKPTIDYGTLKDYEGYLEVNNVLLNVTATNVEKTEIEMLLKQGVYIRK